MPQTEAQDKRNSEAAQTPDADNDPDKPVLPSIHPDDAKDKVFTAILKALLKMGNKPSSPKELANIIAKYKYATLGGATPFATVSSRISQHFKRAAEHNPPRPPLLEKHIDQKHSRKINYSLATDNLPAAALSSSAAVSPHPIDDASSSANIQSQTSPAASPQSEGRSSQPTTRSKRPRPTPLTARSTSRRSRKRQRSRHSETDSQKLHDTDEEAENEPYPKPPARHPSVTALPLSPDTASSPSSSSRSSSSSSSSSLYSSLNSVRDLPSGSVPPSPPIMMDVSDEDESEAEYSDYYEEMLKGDEQMVNFDVNLPEQPLQAAPAKEQQKHFGDTLTVNRRPSMLNTHRLSISDPSSNIFGRKPSLSFNASLLGENDFWTPYSFEQDFDTTYLSDVTLGDHIPLNIAAPESISVAELDRYFNNGNGNDNSNSSSNNHHHAPSTSARTNRKSFSAAMLGPKESSLLQTVLLSSAARGAAACNPPSQDDTDQGQPSLTRRRSWPEIGVTSPFPTDKGSLVSPVPVSGQDSSVEPERDPVTKDPVALPSAQPQISQEDKTSYSCLDSRYPFTITKRTNDDMEFYELESPVDVPGTKVLRFIKWLNHGKVSKPLSYLKQDYVNASQLRKAACPVVGEGSFDADEEWKRGHSVVSITQGPTECHGDWIPLTRARELVQEYEIESSPGLGQFLKDDPLSDADGKLEDSDTDSESAKDLTTEEAIMQSNRTSSIDPPSLDTPLDPTAFVNFGEADKQASSSATSTTFASSLPSLQPNKNNSVNIDSFVAPPINLPTKLSPSSTPPSLADDLTKNMPNLNLSALHQITTAIPSLAHLAPTIDLAKSLAAYMQLSKSNTTSSAPSSNGSSYFDVKAALAKLPFLEALLKTQSSSAPASPTASPSAPYAPSSPSPSALSNPAKGMKEQSVVINTTVPTDPPMFITVMDNVAVCIAILLKTDTRPEYRLMRRLDSGFINGTTLLTAGGIETESEKSMILSFEMERVRVPKRQSPLFGTWIPLRRAQELAVTCSIEHRLGPFLSDDIETYFPCPLPISVPVLPKPRDGRLTALALAALRNSSVHTPSGLSPTSRSTTAYNTTAAQLQQLMLKHPQRMVEIGNVTPKAPLLGLFDKEHEDDLSREVLVVPCSSTSSHPASSSRGSKRRFDRSYASHPSDDDTDTDTDVEEVRHHMKKMREAAIVAMDNGSSMDLEEMMSKACSPIIQSQEPPPSHRWTVRPPTIFHKSRRRPIPEIHKRNSNNDAMHVSPVTTHDLRRPSPAGKLTASVIKKSASWNGALNPSHAVTGMSPRRPIGKKVQRKLQLIDDDTKTQEVGPTDDESIVNRVVEHQVSLRPPAATKASCVESVSSSAALTEVEDVEDEDEEISIGGSDNDDDLR
ncbi:uncharacterized protein BYT42DRAFT_558485 [Radiomyces spectabilis]|uniref:uncharacterized protein n=1 Tax=Radiomyces spectabilis TaxID=64574 RepID=UPI002220FDD8|nr:uncharacterized protein BYT42DRAFT_558485 [Radiomyces spectabilis]KAI8387983.1 hypothetical protein BYT42DRAFT_558485 [Radiomyces spectabilis]